MCSCEGAAFSDREELFSAIPALEYFVCWPWRHLQGWKRDEKLSLVGTIGMGVCYLQLIMSNCVEYIRRHDLHKCHVARVARERRANPEARAGSLASFGKGGARSRPALVTGRAGLTPMVDNWFYL